MKPSPTGGAAKVGSKPSARKAGKMPKWKMQSMQLRAAVGLSPVAGDEADGGVTGAVGEPASSRCVEIPC
jgi:hypothetical protein